MSIYKISKASKELKGTIDLPSSKSISNRLLIIKALCNEGFDIRNLSDAEDTKILQNLLTSSASTLDAGSAGTTLRFLTAYLTTKHGIWVLTGSERMKQRPISLLVNALRQLGAKIEYLGNQGYPPLKIYGTALTGKEVEIDGNVSSQYISALLLIAPTLPNGLVVKLKGEALSQPYINMTLRIMEHFGVKSEWKENVIVVAPGQYIANDFEVEPDWTAASYWYEMAALSDDVDLTLSGLRKESLQGDSIVAEIFKQFGVITTYSNSAVHLKKSQIVNHKSSIINHQSSIVNYNLINCPDIAQTLAVTCAGLNIPATLSGLKTLRIKETDRIVALKNELNKLGVKVEEINEGSIKINPNFNIRNLTSDIQTYQDHRMAMAFAPIAIKSGEVRIKNPQVVNKSYPNFWNDLKKAGFEID